jgi:hypothetical protein
LDSGQVFNAVINRLFNKAAYLFERGEDLLGLVEEGVDGVHENVGPPLEAVGEYVAKGLEGKALHLSVLSCSAHVVFFKR